MSDFLTRLAERQLGRIQTIEPRTKPLYATTMHGAAQVPPIIEEIVPEPSPRRDEEIGTIQISQLRAATPESGRSVNGAAKNSRTAPPPLVEAQTESHGGRKQPGAQPVTRDLDPSRAAHGDAESVPSISARVSTVQSPANIQPLDKPRSSESSSAATPLPAPSGKTKAIAPAPLVSSTKDPLAQRGVGLTAPVSLPSRKDRTDEPAKPAAEVPVRVTIGRIEVTAITQEAPPRRVAAGRKPGVPLDEYLARRHGEGAVSSALAIAGVTAVLRDLLNDGLINHNVSGVLGSTVTVTALPPDRLVPANGTENTQLNLFLHQVTPNAGWRNERLPSQDGSGRNRLTNPPLALDLHYLLSAYGAESLHAEILLGYAMQLLHEMPVLSRVAINNALNPSPPVGTTLPPALRALAECGLADQLEQIKVTPEYLSTEEMSKLWTAVQSHYRPTAAYLATVVLIESTRPTRASLPVLSRGPVDPASGRDRGVIAEASLLPPFPTIQSVAPANLQPAATVGGTIEITGHHLDGSSRTVVLSSARFQIDQEVPASIGGSSTSMQAVVPNQPAGIYQLAVRLVRPGETAPRTSNQLALVIGPLITTVLPISVARVGGNATITLDCQPQVRPGQVVSLILGAREVAAQPFTTATGTLVFAVAAAPVGDHLVRLRVDGIESPLVDYAATPPVFFNNRITIT